MENKTYNLTEEEKAILDKMTKDFDEMFITAGYHQLINNYRRSQSCIYRINTDKLTYNGEIVGIVEPGQLLVDTSRDYTNSPIYEFDGQINESMFGWKVCPHDKTEEFLATRDGQLLEYTNL